MIHRRDFLARSALGASFLPVGIAFAGPFVNEAKAETSTIVKSEMTLAVQTWTFRLFNIDEAIRKTRQVGVDAVEISGGIKIAGQGKRASSMTPEERERLKDVLRESQVRIVSLGGSRGTVEEFEFAVEFGCTVMQGEPPFENLVEISKRAEEYKIRFALHNHAHPNKYWNYQETQKRLEDCTSWLGFCPDTGHMMRSGIDPLQAIKDLLASAENSNLLIVSFV